MKLTGPVRYRLKIGADKYDVVCPDGKPHFSGRAADDTPKLYVISVKDWPVYVGISKQGMAQRLYGGFNATGKNGYHGYRWRHHCVDADLDIWFHEDAPEDQEMLAVETIEAELVYLVRQAGQWPEFQTEIHFHASQPEHRDIARQIIARYTAPAATGGPTT